MEGPFNWARALVMGKLRTEEGFRRAGPETGLLRTYNDRDNRPGTPPPLLALSCVRHSSSVLLGVLSFLTAIIFSSSSVAYSGGVFAKLRGPNLPSPLPPQGHARPSSPSSSACFPHGMQYGQYKVGQAQARTHPRWAPPPGSEYPPAAAADWAPPPYVKEADGEAAKYPPSPGPPPPRTSLCVLLIPDARESFALLRAHDAFAVTAVLALAAAACAHHSSEDTSVSASTISASTPAIPASRCLFRGLHHFHLPNPQADDPLFVDYSRTRMHSRAKMDGGTTTPQPTPTPYAAAGMQRTRKRRGAQHSTDDLLACAALDAGPTQLKDVSAADVARRSSASHLGDINVETDQKRRAKHKACKEIPRPAACTRGTPGTPTELEGFLGSRKQAHRGIRGGRRSLGESGVGRRIQPVGRNRLCRHAPSQAQKVEVQTQDEIQVQRHFVDARLAVAQLPVIPARPEPEVVRGLPSPGLVRGAAGFRLGVGGGWEKAIDGVIHLSAGHGCVNQVTRMSRSPESLGNPTKCSGGWQSGDAKFNHSTCWFLQTQTSKRGQNEHDWFGLTQIYVSWLRSQETKCWVGFWVLDKETDKAVRNEETSPNLTHNYSNFCLVLSTR
ncbi:hypothetical protein B0H14DRAFT_2633116 [Mycena olivaceomarginata]|nr:hypothetical protein B0H14DRAFT_2633116 [Mycena olivaceomarginata]